MYFWYGIKDICADNILFSITFSVLSPWFIQGRNVKYQICEALWCSG